jgi:hypothetical protein
LGGEPWYGYWYWVIFQVAQRGFSSVREIDFFLKRKMAPHQLLISVIA